VPWFIVLSQHLPGGPEKNNKTPFVLYYSMHWQITNIFAANYVQYVYYYYLFYNNRSQHISIFRGSLSGSEYIKQLCISNNLNYFKQFRLGVS
jgi:hypothetical protein